MVEAKDHLDPQNSEQVLSSFHQWMLQQAQAGTSANQAAQPSDPDSDASRKSGGIAPELSIKSSGGASQERPTDADKQANVAARDSSGPSVERVVFRAIGGLLIVVGVAAAWQASQDDETMKLVQAWKHSSMVWFSDALGAARRQSESAAEPSTNLPDQVTPTPAVTTIPIKEFAELNEQLQTVANDLVMLRRNVEQLSARQEQMSRDILTVQATGQNVSEKISSLTQPAPVVTPAAPVRASQRRNSPKLVHSEAPRQPAGTVSLQPPAPASGPPADQPPRPPLPLAAPAETPSPLH